MQLALNIQLAEESTLDSYCWHGNELLFLQLQKSVLQGDGDARRFFISGARGVGKSHLLQALVTEFDKKHTPAIYLPLEQLKGHGPEVLDALSQTPLVCLDDLEAVAGIKAWEEALFYFYNQMKEAQHALVFSASQSINALNIEMPDLKSRLKWEFVFPINELDDPHKITLLQEKASARGLQLSTHVANYLLSRQSRNMKDLVALLDKLDRASLAAQRKLTIPFIKEAIHN